MIGALFRRTVAANGIRLLACGLGLLVWGALLPVIYGTFGKTMSDLIRGNPMLSQFSRFGGGDLFSLSGAIAIGFIHPFTLLLMGLIAVGLPVTSIAGERQRGTLEVLLARPLSRHALYAVLFVAGALFLGLLLAVELGANVVSANIMGVASELQLGNVPLLWLNGWLLFIAFMSIGFAASVSFDRLAPALGVTMVVLLVSYLLEVISSLWPDAAWVGRYSLFHLVQAKAILEGHVSPTDFGLLLLVSAVAVGYAWLAFPRRGSRRAQLTQAREDARLTQQTIARPMPPRRELDGRHALVTGAGRGIGRATALALATAGARVTLLSRTEAELRAVAGEVAALGAEASVLVCDVTDEAAVEAGLSALPAPDIVVNCAGANRPQPLVELEMATFDALMAVNVRSMFIVARHVVRRLVAEGRRGVIVNISSQLGHVGAADRTVYCATKHAVEGFTKALAVELGPAGIRVVSVAPTYVETQMTRHYFENEAFRDEVFGSIPLGQLALPEDVAAAVVFLASDRAARVTGSSLLVDGGWTAR